MLNKITDESLKLMAERFQMLADVTRLAILHSLMEGEKNVGAVVAQTGRSQANVSKHLGMLAESGLVARRKEGLNVFYKVSDPIVKRICDLVCKTIANQPQRRGKAHRVRGRKPKHNGLPGPSQSVP